MSNKPLPDDAVPPRTTEQRQRREAAYAAKLDALAERLKAKGFPADDLQLLKDVAHHLVSLEETA